MLSVERCEVVHTSNKKSPLADIPRISGLLSAIVMEHHRGRMRLGEYSEPPGLRKWPTISAQRTAPLCMHLRHAMSESAQTVSAAARADLNILSSAAHIASAPWMV
jgi:hypothetical protein